MLFPSVAFRSLFLIDLLLTVECVSLLSLQWWSSERLRSTSENNIKSVTFTPTNGSWNSGLTIFFFIGVTTFGMFLFTFSYFSTFFFKSALRHSNTYTKTCHLMCGRVFLVPRQSIMMYDYVTFFSHNSWRESRSDLRVLPVSVCESPY